MFGGSEGIQLVDKLVKLGVCSKEYQVDGEWALQPRGKVTGVRYETSRIKEKLQDIVNLLNYIKERSIESPENADKLRERSAISRVYDSQLTLFSPWGPNYSGRYDLENETRTLQEVRRRLKSFKVKNFRTRFILMPADLYGTEINRLPKSSVEEYFKRLSEIAFQMTDGLTDTIIKPWSQIREENNGRYQELRRQFNERLDQIIKPGQYERILRTAKVFNPSNPEDSARRYCIERLAEGVLVEEVCSPVKMSLVRKDKDNLDGPLPRIYIIRNRAPWLGGE